MLPWLLNLGMGGGIGVADYNAGFVGVDELMKQFAHHDSVQFRAISTPATPPADTFLLYCTDNGAGKMRVTVKYPGGTEVYLDTEV